MTASSVSPVAVTGARSGNGSPGAARPSVSARSRSPRATPSAVSWRVPVWTVTATRGIWNRNLATAAARAGAAPVRGGTPTVSAAAGGRGRRGTAARAGARRGGSRAGRGGAADGQRAGRRPGQPGDVGAGGVQPEQDRAGVLDKAG